MEKDIGVTLRDTSKYRDDVLAATAFNQRRVISSRASKYSSLFKRKASSHSGSRSIDSLAGRDASLQMAADGNLEGLKRAFEAQTVTIKDTDAHGDTLLHYAAMGNRAEVGKYLIDSGIKLDSRDGQGNTALHVAVEEKSIDALHLFLSSGACDIVLNNNGEAALHVAVRLDAVDVVRALLKHPIDITVRGYRKRTPLHVAAELDRVDVCRILHDHARARPDRDFKLCVTDEDELTPIHLAARRGSHRVLKLLFEVCKEHGYLQETIHGLLDEENSTPLHAAIDGGHAAVVEVLLINGASPLHTKHEHPPPIHMACAQGKLDMVKLMVKHCGPVILHKSDEFQRTSLHFSANSVNSAKLFGYIVQFGVNVNATDAQNRTALHIAVMSGSLPGVQMLLNNGADATINDHHGHNALHYAVIHQRKAIITCLLLLHCAQKLVLDRGIKKECTPVHCALKLGYGDLVPPMVGVIRTHMQEIVDAQGNNPLHLAAANGDSVTLANLVTVPACNKLLNEMNDCGASPLHCAAGSGCSRCVQILLEQGATSHKCHCGATPYMFACGKGNSLCAKLLHQAFPFQKDWKDNEGNTSLHLAVLGGSSKTVTFLLDVGSRLMTNYQQETFFDLIIKKAVTKCALATIGHTRWEECLDFISPHFPHPMIGLIIHLPSVAKEVLNRCHECSSLNKVHTEYWEKFCFKYVRLLHIKSCHEDSEGDDTESKVDTESNVVPSRPSIDDLHFPTIHYKGETKEAAQVLKDPNLHSTHALQTMVKYNRSSLLTHPVVREYLDTKWRDYGRLIFYTVLTVHFLHVLFLSIFIAIVPPPRDFESFTTNSSMNSSSARYELTPAANTLRVFALLFCSVNIFPSAAFVYVTRIKGLSLIKVGTILCTYIFLLPSPPLWPAGAIASFCEWFLIIASNVVGIYATMFLRITHTVLTVMSLSFILLLSFCLSLYILASTLPEFSTVGYSLFSTFGYMLGEIQYNQIVRASISGSFEFGPLIFIFVITLAILLSIVMVNLLIGLAVGDIREIQRNATTESVATTIQMFNLIDLTLPKRIIARYDRHCYRKYPNVFRNRFHKYFHIISASIKAKLDDTTSKQNEDTVVDQAAEIAALRQDINHLVTMVTELRDQEQTRN